MELVSSSIKSLPVTSDAVPRRRCATHWLPFKKLTPFAKMCEWKQIDITFPNHTFHSMDVETSVRYQSVCIYKYLSMYIYM